MDDLKYAYFRNGILYNVMPFNSALSLYDNRDVAYKADIVISDGKEYDLRTINGVSSLPVPNFAAAKASEFGNILEMSYIFKLRCGCVDDPELLPFFVKKTLDLMLATNQMGWTADFYLQVIRNYYRLGLIDEGNKFEAQFRKEHPGMLTLYFGNRYELDHLQTKYYFEEKLRKQNEYERIKELFPDKAPKTAKGYLQMRSKMTKNFLILKELAENAGIDIDLRKHLHYCQKKNKYVEMLYTYAKSGNYKKITSCQCSDKTLFCQGKNEYGLVCTGKYIPSKVTSASAEET